MKKTSKSTFMKIYQDINVFDKALERINWLFDEFDTVATNIDSWATRIQYLKQIVYKMHAHPSWAHLVPPWWLRTDVVSKNMENV